LASNCAPPPRSCLRLTRLRSPSPWTRHSSAAVATAEVRVGNVETSGGGRQVFGAVAKADTEIAALIRRSLETVDRASDTELTAFTDGCSGLQSILAEAGCQKPPTADWFHIAMRLQHAKQATSGLSTDTPGRMQAKAAIVAEVERLHWRIWNGKAKNARRTLERVRKVMHVFRGEGVHVLRLCPRRARCGARPARSTPISAAKVHGSSIMQNDTGLAFGSAHR
jgi:hypothetical protein